MTIQNFQTPAGLVSIYDVIDNQNSEKLQDLLNLYRELFPEYVSSLERVREKARLSENSDARFVRHQWLVTVEQAPAGLVSFKLVNRKRLAICLSLGIRPAHRKLCWGAYRRLSEFLIHAMISQVKADAIRYGCSQPVGLIVEIESESATHDPQLRKMRHNLRRRYQEYGFVLLPVTSYEPFSVRDAHSSACIEPYKIEGEDGIPMNLCVLPFVRKDRELFLQKTMLNQVIDALLLEHYNLEESHWIIKQARLSITAKGN